MILRIYYIRSNISISMYCSIVKKIGFNQNIEILSLEIEMQGERTVEKTKFMRLDADTL